MKTVAFYTLGCKVNIYETEAMAGLFTQKGYRVVDFEDNADIYIINTCTVTAVGDKKSRQMIRRAKRRNPQGVVAVTGCYAQVAQDEVKAIEGVNLVIGTAHKGEIVELVEALAEEQISLVEDKLTDYEDFGLGSFHSRTRATVKIQDGCDNFCSYCIIPYARGRVRSRPLSSIINEVQRLGEQGFSEIVLVGIELASYGKDLDVSLIDVIEQVSKVIGIKRIRLGSLEPRLITEELVNRLLYVDKLCPHFHLSLQSGCDSTLMRMNRKYAMTDYFAALEQVRRIPDCAVTTDIMVGFPGETDEDFANSLENVKKCAFSAVHVFPYSPRKGTKAAAMKNQLPDEIKVRRAAEMAHETIKQQLSFLKMHIGRVMPVLFEDEGEGLTANYLRVRAVGGQGLTDVMINDVDGEVLVGEIKNN